MDLSNPALSGSPTLSNRREWRDLGSSRRFGVICYIEIDDKDSSGSSSPSTLDPWPPALCSWSQRVIPSLPFLQNQSQPYSALYWITFSGNCFSLAQFQLLSLLPSHAQFTEYPRHSCPCASYHVILHPADALPSSKCYWMESSVPLWSLGGRALSSSLTQPLQ